jgi:DNA-binding transcriptional LysR family regulator
MPELPPQALASLVAIADHGSLSAAARVRGLAQPTLSRQVQELERQIGVQLVERDAQGSRPTPAGRALADGARDALATLAALPARVRALADEVAGTVRLGSVDSLAIYTLPPVLAAFMRQHPRVQVRVQCASSPQLVEGLRAGDLDLALGTTENPALTCERLFDNPLVLVHPHELPAAQVPATLAELAQRPVITFGSGLTVRRLLEQAFRSAGLAFTPVMELANVEVIKAMVRSGLGLGVIPDGCLPHGELASRPLPGCTVMRTIRLAHRPQDGRPVAVERLLAHLRASLRQGAG